MPVTEFDDRDRPADSDVDIVDVQFVATDLSLAGWLRIDIRRAAGATRFLASIHRPDLEPVTVLDYDLPVPTSAFEFRSSGVWVELCCEAPLDHWTVGLEAFGLALPENEVVTPSSFGDRVPVGLDLDLETVAAPEGDAGAFTIDLGVHGEVLVGDCAYEIAATGTRTRLTSSDTGVRPLSDLGVRPLGELTVRWPEADGRPSVERRGWFGGSRPGWAALDYSAE